MGAHSGDNSLSPLEGLVVSILVLLVVVVIALHSPVRDTSLLWSHADHVTALISGDERKLEAPQPLAQAGSEKALTAKNSEQGQTLAMSGHATLVPQVGYHSLPDQPLFTTTPYWAGDSIVTDNGSTENLTVAQAQGDPRLSDLPLYPKQLASDLYFGGFASKAPGFAYFDQSDANEPVLVRGASSWYWVFPLRVGGSDPHYDWIKGLLVIDARSGRVTTELFPTEVMPASQAELLVLGPSASAEPLSLGKASVTYQGMLIRGTTIIWKFSTTRNDRAQAVFVDGTTGRISPSVPAMVVTRTIVPPPQPTKIPSELRTIPETPVSVPLPTPNPSEPHRAPPPPFSFHLRAP